jgi:thioredoxin reductase (NADPH)
MYDKMEKNNLVQMKTMEDRKTYDIAIVGSGPAGFTASIYASRYRLSNIVFGKMIGGTISEAHKVCNYPGFPDISGFELGMKFHEHAKMLGGETSNESITDIVKEGGVFKLVADSGITYLARTVVIATGTVRNKLGLANEDYYLGKGLSYCATCDAMFYKDKVVGIVGGSNAATMAAVLLADIAKKVYIIYRGTELRGEAVWIEQVKANSNIECIFTTVLTGLEGKDRLEKVKLSRPYKDSEYLNVDGLFIEIGSEPNKSLPVKLGVKLDEQGYVEVKQDQSTSIEGIWAAGDGTTGSNKFRQVVTSASEGSIAANSILEYLKNI